MTLMIQSIDESLETSDEAGRSNLATDKPQNLTFKVTTINILVKYIHS